MKKTAFLFPVFMSLLISYYFYKSETTQSVTYFLDLAKSSTKAEECLDIILLNTKGSSAFYSMGEAAIVDAYINGDIELVFSNDVALFEKQILTLHQMVYDGLFTFGWAVEKLFHVYNHWIAQYVNSYRISYEWIDLHYTDSDAIIASFLDDKYMLYSHGVGYGPSLPAKSDDRYVNLSRLALDISLEEGAANKLQYIVDECKLSPGSKVLDVGGGFGSFPTFAIPLGIHVHSLTISSASFDRLQSLSEELSANVCGCEDGKNSKPAENECTCGSLTVTLKNFWELRGTKSGESMAGTFNAIVCLGSIEHLVNYDRLMESAEYYLKPGGYLHVDGFGTKLGLSTNYFMQKYIYPGDSAPVHASSYLKAWENSNLLMVGLHFDNENYRNTWYLWAQKFERMVCNGSHPLSSSISQRSVKIFRLYLWGMLMSYSHPATPVQAWRILLQKPLF